MLSFLKIHKWSVLAILTLGVIVTWALWLRGGGRAEVKSVNLSKVQPYNQPPAPRPISPSRDRKTSILEDAGLLPTKEKPANDGPDQAGHSLAEILGESDLGVHDRVGALKALVLPLNDKERRQIDTFLASANPPPGVPIRDWRWLMDELFTILRHDGENHGKFASQLAALYRDTTVDPFIRDYAVQHLGHLLSENASPGQIVPVLREATSQSQSTIAGSALLALSQNLPGDLETSERAVKLASDPATHLSSRLTALQVAATQKNPAALVLALGLASDNNQPSPLRISAIATIAKLGSTEQKPLLQGLAQSRDIRIKTASTSALQKIIKERR